MVGLKAARAERPESGAGAEIRFRRAILVVAAVAALTAVLAGLARLGIPLGWGPAYAVEHGPMFVLGVFGTVIALERAVALARGWAFAAPAAGAAAAAGMLCAAGWAVVVAVLSSAALVAVNAAIVRRQSLPFTRVMLLGSALLLAGNVALMGGVAPFEVMPAWIAFFVLTIAAERLELSRLAPTPAWASRTLTALCVALGAAAVLRLLGAEWVPRVAGAAMAGLGLWQLRFDIARRTVRQRGLPRFAALGVLTGAGWLLVAGGIFAALPIPPAGPLYDAPLHSVFVGYVLSMVFAHAPIILPAVARLAVPFTPVLYVPLAVLHAGLVVRVGGDLAAVPLLRQAGGAANALALALFALAVIWARRGGRR